MEYLNEFNSGTLPLAKLELKIGCPVMVLKNLDAANEVCNGSRGILTRYSNRVLEVKLLTGEHAGQKVFIPRIANQPGEDENFFRFTRWQFPIRVCSRNLYYTTAISQAHHVHVMLKYGGRVLSQ